jgi:hypothetical protein
MPGYFRLRQICLVAPELERAVTDIETIFGVKTCFRDPAVGKYGLANALFPFGRTFLEIVAPTRDGTAAGRFLERSGGVGGYMAIFSCDDVERRSVHAEQLGIAIAHTMDYDEFFGIQLHPRDCRAAMIEFDRTRDGASPDGPYHPAGHHWQDFVKTDVVRAITAIDIESPRPQGIAAHWSAILEKPLGQDMTIPTEMIDIRFVQGASDARETLRTIHVGVADEAHIRQGAEARGYAVRDGAVEMYGVRFLMS